MRQRGWTRGWRRALHTARRTALATALLAAPLAAVAQARVEGGYATGDDGYRGTSIHADVDLYAGRVNVGVDRFVASQPAQDDTTQSALAVDWQPRDGLGLNYRYSDTDDGRFEVTGHDFGLALDLDRWAGWSHRVTLEAGYARFSSEVLAGSFAGRSLAQTRPRLGLAADLSDTVGVQIEHQWQRYERDPADIARALLRRSRNTAQAAFTLLGFADHTTTLSGDWAITETLTWRASTGRTVTVLGQQLKFARLALRWRATPALTLGAAMSRDSAAAVATPGGAVLQPASQGDEFEVSAGWRF